eukprot:scaffold45070_cov23-Tisochrysis_lutea.AAC.4
MSTEVTAHTHTHIHTHLRAPAGLPGVGVHGDSLLSATPSPQSGCGSASPPSLGCLTCWKEAGVEAYTQSLCSAFLESDLCAFYQCKTAQ